VHVQTVAKQHRLEMTYRCLAAATNRQ